MDDSSTPLSPKDEPARDEPTSGGSIFSGAGKRGFPV
jgi:hypothetical protein